MLSRDFEIYYYSDRSLPNVKSHTHDYYEFYFFLGGDIKMHIDKNTFVPVPGTMMVIPPGVPHYATLTNGESPYRRFVFWVTEDFLGTLGSISEDYRFLADRAKKSGTFFMHKFTEIAFNSLQGKVFSLIDEINSERFGRDAKILISVSDFMLSLNRAVYESENPTQNDSDSESLYHSIILYIETHIDEDLSLDELSEKFHVSKYHISHLFTKTNGLPLHKYIIKKRLGMCLDAILSGQDISAVSSGYGFSDYSVFYRAFVKEYGKSPKQYKDEIMRNK